MPIRDPFAVRASICRPRLEPLEDRAAPAARLQAINDMIPSALLRLPVNVYVDGAEVATYLAPGDGTPFLTVPSGVPVQIDFTNPSAPAFPLATVTRTFADGSTNVVAGAWLDRTNPPRPLPVTDGAREAADDPSSVDLMVFNGVGYAPPVDVRIVGVGRVADDLPVEGFSGYRSLAPGRHVIEVFGPDGAIRLGTFEVDLSAAAGKAAVLALGGTLTTNPALAWTRSIDPTVVFADGSSIGQLPPPTPQTSRPAFAAGGGGAVGLFSQTGVRLLGRDMPHQVGMPVVATDVTGDGVDDLIGAHGPALPQLVYAIDGRTGDTAFTLGNPFEATFTGGAFVAAGDFDDDGLADLVITPDRGGSGRVRVLSGKDRSVLADFFGIEDVNFRGGARAAVGDVNGDGVPDLLVAAGFGGGPRIAVFDGSDLRPGATPRKLVGDFFVFENTLRNGAYVAAGDLNADGKADPVFGGGPSGGPRVLAISGADLTTTGAKNLLADFFAGDVDNRDGVRVATHYLDDDTRADVLAGLGSAGEPQVRTFLSRDVLRSPPAALEVSPFPDLPAGGVFVG